MHKCHPQIKFVLKKRGEKQKETKEKKQKGQKENIVKKKKRQNDKK